MKNTLAVLVFLTINLVCGAHEKAHTNIRELIVAGRAKTARVVIYYIPWGALTNSRLSPENVRERPSIKTEFFFGTALSVSDVLLDALEQSHPKASGSESDVRCRVDFLNGRDELLLSVCLDSGGTLGYLQGKPIELGVPLQHVLRDMLKSLEY